jgi:DUF1680 family protein
MEIKKIILGIILTSLIFTSISLMSFTSKADLLNQSIRKRKTVPRVYNEIPLGNIKPEGWLLDQLKTMRHNSTGHLDEIYDKIKIDNGWLGGKGDNWEETPYWLDGALPLAYLLDDKELKQKVLKYVNWSIDNQRPSGYFGPITEWELETGKKVDTANCDKGQDWWPRMVMLKVIKQYYSATSDERVIPFMEEYFTYQESTLDKCTIGHWSEWAESRGIENVKIIQWLYNINKDEDLLKLADRIQSQSFQWSEWLGNRDWVINAAVNPDGKDWMHRHGVNVGMALKAPVENFERTGDSSFLKDLDTGFHDLMTLHGLPNGIFSADEDLHGNAPTQGTELCAIVETMYSLEDIIGVTGNPKYMDALERTTFNAMPPQTTDDYSDKQYFQLANQVEIQRGVYAFTLPFDRGMNNVLGTKSGYTCCYVNMHQGWTKFAQHLWFKTQDNGLAALLYSPNTLKTTVGPEQQEVIIKEDTQYPFGDSIKFEVQEADGVQFSLQMRIPAWCTDPSLTVNGEPVKLNVKDQITTLDRTWNKGDKVTLNLPMEVRVSSWAENSKAIERGPLVYGLKMGQQWDGSHQEQEGDYYTVAPTTPWNYGLLESEVKNPEQGTQVIQEELKKDFKWNLENAPVEIKIKAKLIPDWKAVNGLAYLPVSGRDGFYKGNVSDKIETITLVPIGFTKLRIVAFPVVQ